MQLQRLNMDNSWFISINGLRLLVDPWLEGQVMKLARIQRIGKADLETYPVFRGRVLEIDHFNVVNL